MLTKSSVNKFLREFYKDESGQSTTEYVLLLLFVVVAVKAVGGQLKDKLSKLMDTAMGKTEEAIQETEF